MEKLVQKLCDHSKNLIFMGKHATNRHSHINLDFPCKENLNPYLIYLLKVQMIIRNWFPGIFHDKSLFSQYIRVHSALKGEWGWCSSSHPCFKGFPIYIYSRSFGFLPLHHNQHSKFEFNWTRRATSWNVQ